MDQSERIAAGRAPVEEYIRRRDKALGDAARLTRLDGRLGDARLGLFIAGLVLAWLAWRGSVGWPWATVAFLLFVPLVIVHGRVMAARRRAEGVSAHHDRGLERLDGRWAGAGSPGTRFLDETHPYAADLDLFGAGSLFERLCTARTASGESTLAGWLLGPADPVEVARRVEAVIDLKGRLDFREDLALLGDDVRTGVAPESLAAWGATPYRSASLVTRLAVGLLAVSTFVAVFGWLLQFVSGWVATAMLLAEVATAYGFAGRSRRALAEVEEREAELATLSGLLARVERERFDAPRLVELQSALDDGGRPASARVARLALLVRWLESLHNIFFALFGSLLLWKTQFALAIESWRAREGASIGPWIDAIGRIEALASLANYAFEAPGDIFPEFTTIGPCLEGEGIGHPLLPDASCVRNDLRLGPDLKVLAVSGSNMSGKSTWLRAVGTNVVLAQAGAPVRARRFRLSPLTVGGTLGVHDSLQAGRSRFYAEILRLKQLVGLAEGAPPLLFLIDEILHGTNSADRLIGAEAVIKALADRGAIGLFTTHDLALAEVAGRLGFPAENVHFADQIGPDGRLAFDYRMRPGVVRQSNALALMRAVGLEV